MAVSEVWGKCGENVGKGLTKSPSQIPERTIKVIRLGFEPKTHSLEGCCSIQLSYRTDPYVLLTCSGTDVKSGHKDSDYFWICNKILGPSLFYLNCGCFDWFRKHGNGLICSLGPQDEDSKHGNGLICAFEMRNGGGR